MRKSASKDQIEQLISRLDLMKLNFHMLDFADSQALALTDDLSTQPSHLFTQLPAVAKVVRLEETARLAGRSKFNPVEIGTLKIAKGHSPVFIAGPCSVEGEAGIIRTAGKVKEAGAQLLRGGAYKPRSSPYEFQGLGAEGLRYLSQAKQASGLPVVSEITDAKQLESFQEHIDIFQVGARNMFNYELLKELGRCKRPVLLKRSFAATISEWLNAAEYIISAGNEKVILCERGIRTFETQTRNTLDLNAVALLKRSCGLPVVVDPSHGTGKRELVGDLSRAAIACGADGLLIEVHESPDQSISDREQAICPEQLKGIIADCKNIWELLNPQAAATISKSSAALGASV